MELHCKEYDRLSRFGNSTKQHKQFQAFANGAHLASVPDWMPKVNLADPHIGPRGDALVVIFLRGGADGLNMVVPHGEPAYYESRPTIAIPRPDDRRQNRSIDLDGFFGLHPTLAPLHEIYRATDLGIVHAVGSTDETRSHFAAQTLMESGEGQDYSGWLARHLATLDSDNDSPLRAVALGSMLPESLFGAKATVARRLGEHRLRVGAKQVSTLSNSLQKLYGSADEILSKAADQTLETLTLIQKVKSTHKRSGTRRYPSNQFGRSLRAVASLISANVGVEVATVNMGGWDTHVTQGGTDGAMAKKLAVLAEGLAAFYEDLLPVMNRVTVVVMSEFGRRLEENGGRGTDHGHGNMMLMLGEGIKGGKVHARWPGLAPEQLAGPGDLAITTDYRDVLSEILRVRLGNPFVNSVFPQHKMMEQSIGAYVSN